MASPSISITASLALAPQGKDGFRSQSLWLPCGARGVFGGQVIGQALVAAGETVGPELGLHSQHCYFLLAARADTDITYHVERLRDGRSYATRAVKAVQHSKPIFVLICSFTAPTLASSQPRYQLAYPTDVLPPSECPLEEDRWRGLMERYRGKWGARRCADVEGYIRERRESPIAIAVALRNISSQTAKDSNVRMLWLRIRVTDGESLDERLTKAAIAYLTDFQFIGTAARAAGLTRMSEPKLSMLASLDHSTHFYPPAPSASTWLLHVMDSPLVSIDAGRGVVRGLLYTERGDLVAVTSQEGVVRAERGRAEADARGLVEGGGAEEGDEENETVKAKL